MIAFVALGSNIESPREQIVKAFDEVGQLPKTRSIARSSLYRTAPVGYAGQPEFINAVAKVETSLPAMDLLKALLGIERAHGRSRDFKNAPRTLDLDLLLYGDLKLEEQGLTLPHPRMHERAFVLIPLNEIAPQTAIPGRGTVAELVAGLPDAGVRRIA